MLEVAIDPTHASRRLANVVSADHDGLVAVPASNLQPVIIVR